MAIKQISVFVENKKGALSDIVKMISGADINLRALSIADTKDFGILRMIVSDTDKTKEALSDDVIVNVTEVVAVKMDDKEGALYTILKVLDEAEVNIDYSYAFTGSKAGAYVVLRVSDVDTAEKLLKDKGFATLDDSDMAEI